MCGPPHLLAHMWPVVSLRPLTTRGVAGPSRVCGAFHPVNGVWCLWAIFPTVMSFGPLTAHGAFGPFLALYVFRPANGVSCPFSSHDVFWPVNDP